MNPPTRGARGRIMIVVPAVLAFGAFGLLAVLGANAGAAGTCPLERSAQRDGAGHGDIGQPSFRPLYRIEDVADMARYSTTMVDAVVVDQRVGTQLAGDDWEQRAFLRDIALRPTRRDGDAVTDVIWLRTTEVFSGPIEQACFPLQVGDRLVAGILGRGLEDDGPGTVSGFVAPGGYFEVREGRVVDGPIPLERVPVRVDDLWARIADLRDAPPSEVEVPGSDGPSSPTEMPTAIAPTSGPTEEVVRPSFTTASE